MARQRMLNPSFFTDAELVSLSPLHRILFQGLWCLADREGRLVDRPLDLKMRILPGDNCDVKAMLADLTTAGFLVRYEVAGSRCIWIRNFRKHQNPHFREPSSRIPPAPGQPAHVAPFGFDHDKVASQQSPGSTPHASPQSPGSGGLERGGSRAESESESESESVEKLSSASPPRVLELASPVGVDESGPARMLAIWNELAPEALPRARETKERTAKLQTWLKSRSLKEWRLAVTKVAASPFLRGDRSSFRASIDWLLKPANLTKVLEGNYDDASAVAAQKAPPCDVGQCDAPSVEELGGHRLCQRHQHEANIWWRVAAPNPEGRPFVEADWEPFLVWLGGRLAS